MDYPIGSSVTLGTASIVLAPNLRSSGAVTLPQCVRTVPRWRQAKRHVQQPL